MLLNSVSSMVHLRPRSGRSLRRPTLWIRAWVSYPFAIRLISAGHHPHVSHLTLLINRPSRSSLTPPATIPRPAPSPSNLRPPCSSPASWTAVGAGGEPLRPSQTGPLRASRPGQYPALAGSARTEGGTVLPDGGQGNPHTTQRSSRTTSRLRGECHPGREGGGIPGPP